MSSRDGGKIIRTIACAVVVAALMAIAGKPWAAQRVGEARPASAGGFVGVYIAAGAVRVVGWTRREARVTCKRFRER